MVLEQALQRQALDVPVSPTAASGSRQSPVSTPPSQRARRQGISMQGQPMSLENMDSPEGSKEWWQRSSGSMRRQRERQGSSDGFTQALDQEGKAQEEETVVEEFEEPPAEQELVMPARVEPEPSPAPSTQQNDVPPQQSPREDPGSPAAMERLTPENMEAVSNAAWRILSELPPEEELPTYRQLRGMVEEKLGCSLGGKAWRRWFRAEVDALVSRLE